MANHKNKKTKNNQQTINHAHAYKTIRIAFYLSKKG